MKKQIALVAGGYSGEYEVSLKSADGLYSFIDRTRYDLHRVLLTREAWSVLLADRFRHDRPPLLLLRHVGLGPHL